MHKDVDGRRSKSKDDMTVYVENPKESINGFKN